jgi:DNA adenine methylase
MSGSDLRCSDFRTTLANVVATDLVYCDPPYTVSHNNNGFLQYNENLFSWNDQEDLAAWVCEFAASGGKVMVSNAAHRPVERLYDSLGLQRLRIRRRSRVAASRESRGWRWEFLAVSRACVELPELRRLLSEHGVDSRVV